MRCSDLEVSCTFWFTEFHYELYRTFLHKITYALILSPQTEKSNCRMLQLGIRNRCSSVGGNAAKQEKPERTGQTNEQTSDPNGARSDVVVEESTNDGGQCARQAPAQPVNGHVAAAQICRRKVRHVFAGSRDESKFTEGKNDHTEPESPKTTHERHTACAQCIDEHAHTKDRKGAMLPCDARYKVLHEYTHQRIGGRNPAV